MNFSEINYWEILAGLGLFLFGMYMLEDSLKALIGRSFKKFISKHTKNRIKAVLAGTFVTAILQSSSMVTLLVMSFAGAGILGLNNGIGMILGANLGTTFTGWMVSLLGFKLNLGEIILPFLAIGGLGIIFLKSPKWSNFSKLLMGFSFMFLGLNYLKEGFESFASGADMSFLTDKPKIYFFLFGIMLTASIQSSSASMMIYLSSLSAGLITLPQALFLVIGSDIGTTITALIGTLNANSVKKKVGWAQFFFNVFSGSVAMILMPITIWLIMDIFAINDPLISLVTFHSIANLTGIILVLPFLNQFTIFINRVVRKKENNLCEFIAMVQANETHAAIEAAEKEVIIFYQEGITFNESNFSKVNNGVNLVAYMSIQEREGYIMKYLNDIQKSDLTTEEVSNIQLLLRSMRNLSLSVKKIKDIKHNLDDISNSTNDELFSFYKQICNDQRCFYQSCKEFLEIEHKDSESLQSLITLSAEFSNNWNTLLIQILQHSLGKDILIASLLNLIHELNYSNEHAINSIRLYLDSKHNF